MFSEFHPRGNSSLVSYAPGIASPQTEILYLYVLPIVQVRAGTGRAPPPARIRGASPKNFFPNRYALVIFRRSARDVESFARCECPMSVIASTPPGKVSPGLSAIVYADRSIFVTRRFIHVFITL